MTALGAVLLASCGLFSTEEEAEAEQEAPSGQFTALLNGELWQASAQAGIDEGNRLSLFAGVYDSLSYWHDRLSFSLRFNRVGTYPLSRHGGDDFYGALYNESDGDAGIAAYDPTASEANQMTLTRYDSAKGIVEGTFEVTLVVREGDREPKEPLPGLPPFMQRRRPDTLRFTEGRFYVEGLDDRRSRQ